MLSKIYKYTLKEVAKFSLETFREKTAGYSLDQTK